jgi:hypothetical protein
VEGAWEMKMVLKIETKGEEYCGKKCGWLWTGGLSNSKCRLFQKILYSDNTGLDITEERIFRAADCVDFAVLEKKK